MAGISIADQIAAGRKPESPTAGLEAKFDEFLNFVRGEDIEGAYSSSGSPIMMGRQAARDIRKGLSSFRQEELPDLFRMYQEDINAERLTPMEARYAYANAARAAGAKDYTEKAAELGKMPRGMTNREQYQRYIPFMQQSASDLLGRTFSQPEIENYISSLQGLNITNPADVASSIGKIITTGDEYKLRQYRFKPTQLTSFTPTNTDEYIRNLNAAIG